MLEVQYRWDGTEQVAHIEAAGWEAVQRATVLLWQKCCQEVGISNPRPHKTPSQPGEPPRLRTGWGQRNIRYELDRAKGVGRVGVGVNAKYMAFLDQGTRRIRPRPWLLATAKKYRTQLQAILRSK